MTDYINKETFIAKSREANPDIYTQDVSDDSVYNDMLTQYPDYKSQIYDEQNIITKGISKLQDFREYIARDVKARNTDNPRYLPERVIQTDLESIWAETKAMPARAGAGLQYFQADNKYDYIDTTFRAAQIKKKLISNQELEEQDYNVLRGLMRNAGVSGMEDVMADIQSSENPAEALSLKIDKLVANQYMGGFNPDEKDEHKVDVYNSTVESAMQYDNQAEWIINTFAEKDVRDWVKNETDRLEAIEDYREVESSLKALADRKGFDRRSISYMVGAGIPSVGVSMGTAILLSPFTGGTSLAAGVLSLAPAAMLSMPEALDTYRAARDAGADRDTAKYFGLASFTANTALEHFGIQSMLGKFGGKHVPKALVAALTEGATEFSQEEVSSIMELYGYNKAQLAEMSADDKLNAFVYRPLKAGLVGAILGGGTNVTFDTVSAQYDGMKKKAVLKGLNPALVEKYDTYLKKNKKISKMIQKLVKNDTITDFSKENILAKIEESGIPQEKAQETYDALMSNPVFVAKSEIADSTRTSKFLFGSSNTDTAQSTLGSIMKSIGNIPAGLNRMAYDPMDVMANISPTLARSAKRVLRKGQADVDTAINDMVGEARTVFEDLNVPLRKNVALPTGEKMQLNKVLTAYRHLMQIEKSGAKKAIKDIKRGQLGLSSEQLTAIKTYVESDTSLLTFSQKLDTIFETMYYYLNEGYKITHKGKELTNFESYFPMMYDVLSNKGSDFGDIVDAVVTPRGSKTAGNVDPKSARERAKVSRESIDLNIPIDRLLNSMTRKVADYYGMSAPAMQIQSMLNAVGPDIVENYGSKTYTYFQDTVKSMARGVAVPRYLMGADRALRKMKETSYSVLNLNMTVWATQSASFWNGANEIGMQAALEGARIVAENPKQAVKQMYELSQEAKYRMGVDYTQEEIRRLDKAIKTDKLARGVKELREAASAGMVPMKVVDMYTTASIWQGAYNKYLNENAGAIQEDAIEFADDAIAASQPMTNTIHRSLLSRLPVLHIFSQFGAARVKGGAQLAQSMSDLSRGEINPLQFINSVVYSKVAPALSVALARTFFSKWQDDPSEQIWDNYWSALIGSNIFMGQIMSSWTYHDGNLVMPAAGRPVKLFIGSMKNLMSGKTQKAIYDALELSLNSVLGISAQIPYKKAVSFIDNFD